MELGVGAEFVEQAAERPPGYRLRVRGGGRGEGELGVGAQRVEQAVERTPVVRATVCAVCTARSRLVRDAYGVRIKCVAPRDRLPCASGTHATVSCAVGTYVSRDVRVNTNDHMSHVPS